MIRRKDVKLLWGQAGNRCAMPGCEARLSSGEGNGVVWGEIAHIRGEKPGSPRWDPEFRSTEVNTYSNLILLCPTHHTEIDKNPTQWTVGELNRIKKQHEDRVRNTAQQQAPSNWISEYERQHVDLPPIPEFLACLVLNYKAGDKVSKEMKLIPPGMQFLRGLLPSQENKLLQLVEWLGQDPEDYDYEVIIRRMGPPRQPMVLIPKRLLKL